MCSFFFTGGAGGGEKNAFCFPITLKCFVVELELVIIPRVVIGDPAIGAEELIWLAKHAFEIELSVSNVCASVCCYVLCACVCQLNKSSWQVYVAARGVLWYTAVARRVGLLDGDLPERKSDDFRFFILIRAWGNKNNHKNSKKKGLNN